MHVKDAIGAKQNVTL